jgi:ATP-dependent DNA helicase DinG
MTEDSPQETLATRVHIAFDRLYADGVLAERRPGQLEMALAVAQAIEQREHLVVRAGTGIGKTLAYLVPAILADTKTVVATATRSLQEQLASRDLPNLSKAIDRPFTWSVLKGRTNYVCLQRLAETSDDALDAGDVDAHQAIADWAETTTTGDRDEVPDEPAADAWRRVSVRSDECPGKDRCPSGARCFAERAREAAVAADVVVTNHHMYAAGLFASHQILPPHDVAIFDEGHRVDEAFRQASATRVDPVGLIYFVRTNQAGVSTENPSTVSALTAVRAQLSPLVGSLVNEYPAAVADGLTEAASQMREHARLAREAAREGESQPTVRHARACGLALENISLSTNDDRVAWVEGSEARPVLRTLSRAPSALPAFEGPHRRVAILTSASVGPLLAGEVGLEDGVRSLDVPSPFDYPRQSLLYCATDLPDPRSAQWTPASHERLAELIRAAGGRTLALFTSWRALTDAAERVAPLLDIEVMIQGSVGRRELLQRFQAEPTSCAFGTMGLAEGLDIPGTSLTLVTIDRLPFPPMGDPYLSARRFLKGDNAFREVDLRQAAIVLSQAGGRLIRTGVDRGAFAVLDPRLARARYRWDLIRALPPMTRTTELGVVCDFLRSCDDSRTRPAIDPAGG